MGPRRGSVGVRETTRLAGHLCRPTRTRESITTATMTTTPASISAFGFHIGDDCDVAYGIGPAWYNFCPVAYIGDRDCWRHFRDHRDNFAFIGRTRNVTNLNFRRDGAGRFGHVRAEGPSVAALECTCRDSDRASPVDLSFAVGRRGIAWRPTRGLCTEG